MFMMTTQNTDKHAMFGHSFLVAGRTYQLTGWHLPHLLRAGDMIHVDEDTLSEVVRTEKHRAGTRLVVLADGRQICVAGENEIAVFATA